MDGARLSQNLATLNLGLLDTAEQSADVVASFSVVEQLAEHLDAGNDGLARSVHQTNDLNFLAHLQLATLYTAGSNGTTASDGEYVLDRHEERLVSFTIRGRDIGRQQRPSARGCKRTPERSDRWNQSVQSAQSGTT